MKATKTIYGIMEFMRLILIGYKRTTGITLRLILRLFNAILDALRQKYDNF